MGVQDRMEGGKEKRIYTCVCVVCVRKILAVCATRVESVLRHGAMVAKEKEEQEEEVGERQE